MKYLIFLTVCCTVLSVTLTATTGNPSNASTDALSTVKTTKTATSPPTPAHTTPGLSPKEQCQAANESCDKCVKVGSVQCVWCASSSKCLLKEHAIPTKECGGLSNAKWAVCWVNYEALIIACGAVGGVLILALTICICCCCCCKKGNQAKYDREDAKNDRKRAEMKAAHAERRAERKKKTDEIRKKYGLMKEDNPYQRFDGQ